VVAIAFFTLSVGLILLFIFITGFHDEGNLIATIITSRSLNVYLIFTIAFLSQFLGTLFLGTKVAETTITSLINLEQVRKAPDGLSLMICAAMLGAVLWNIITWVAKIPSSSSHAIIGGLMGPFLVRYGLEGIHLKGIIVSVLLPLFTSPLIGYLFGFLLYKLNQFCLEKLGIRSKNLFRVSHVITCILINAFQGSNDAQKGMGVFALLWLGTATQNNEISVPHNLILWSALAISFGLILGGLKMIKSVGTKIFPVRALHSVSAQMSALAVIGSASLFGFPVSGTQIVNSAILGVGAADRPNAVGWEYAKHMMMTWIITIPSSLLLSVGFYFILSRMIGANI
jgi:PiT family inorganic phosphate transporter